MGNVEILAKFLNGSPLLQRENSLLVNQNTTRRLPSTFPQIVFSSNAGFTLSRLNINYITFMTQLDIQRTSVRPDKDMDVQLR
jgi:hypothetical protein